MKTSKCLFSWLVSLGMILALCIPAFADNYYVVDEADILTPEEETALDIQAAEAADTYGCGLYILTVNNYTGRTGTDEQFDAARQLYEEYNMGIGEDKSGIMLMLSMEDRKYYVLAHGFGNTVVSDYGREYLSDQFLDDFGDDDWVGGFEDYLTAGIEMIDMAANGEPMEQPSGRGYGIAVCVVIAFIIAFIVRAGLKNQLKSVAIKTVAAAYQASGGVNMTKTVDRFTHTTRTRVKKSSEDDSSSSSDSGGGYSGGGGSF